jgi:hypothetical protein
MPSIIEVGCLFFSHRPSIGGILTPLAISAVVGGVAGTVLFNQPFLSGSICGTAVASVYLLNKIKNNFQSSLECQKIFSKEIVNTSLENLSYRDQCEMSY